MFGVACAVRVAYMYAVCRCSCCLPALRMCATCARFVYVRPRVAHMRDLGQCAIMMCCVFELCILVSGLRPAHRRVANTRKSAFGDREVVSGGRQAQVLNHEAEAARSFFRFLLAAVLRSFTPRNGHLVSSFNKKDYQCIKAHLLRWFPAILKKNMIFGLTFLASVFRLITPLN